MSNRWTSRKVNISKKYTEQEREAIAFEIISYIQERSKAGKGKDNKKWQPPADKYSKEYKQSLDFKNAGKSSTVNLTLSGDMLNSIDLLEDTDGQLTIGISSDDPDHGKAEGNIRGSYGKPTGSRAKARDFLALSKGEVDRILKKFPLKDDERRQKAVENFITATVAAEALLGEDNENPTLGELIL